jgi:hypothetical protein
MTFDNSFNAHLMKSKLADNDIESYVYDENIITLNPIYNFAIGGVKLKINSSYLNKAKSILDSVSATPLTNEEDEIIRCPRCNSENIDNNFITVRNIKSFLAIVAAFLTMTYPLYLNIYYYCRDCKYNFR